MAKKPTSRYYLVEAGLLPEIFLKVMEAKELLHTGECATVGEAAARVGISRSAFYKYRDGITAFQDLLGGRILTINVLLRDETDGFRSSWAYSRAAGPTSSPSTRACRRTAAPL